jgi:hypothetical protein
MSICGLSVRLYDESEVEMQYVCLIYEDGKPRDRLDPDAVQKMYDEYGKLGQEAAQKGVMRGGNELTGVSSATSVRLRDGKRLVTDGPFAETKEVLTGFMIFECASLDEALDWASKIPSAKWGTIEVRPVVEHAAQPA